MNRVKIRDCLSRYDLQMYLAKGSPLSVGLPEESFQRPWYTGSLPGVYMRNLNLRFAEEMEGGVLTGDDMYIVCPGPGNMGYGTEYTKTYKKFPGYEVPVDFQTDTDNWLVIDARSAVSDQWQKPALIRPFKKDVRPLFLVRRCNSKFANPYARRFEAAIQPQFLLGCFLTHTRGHEPYWGRPNVDYYQQPYFVISFTHPGARRHIV
jgi:hypothetical protein